MRAFSTVLLAAFAAIAVATEPTVLTDETFTTALGSGQPHFIKFYAPWCGHCKRLAPTWDQLAEQVASDEQLRIAGVHISKVDCTVHRSACTEAGVRGYPTLVYFKGDGSGASNGVKYSGNRELASLLAFVTTQASS